VNTKIDQPVEHDIHLGRNGLGEYHGRGEYHVPWVDQSLYSPQAHGKSLIVYYHVPRVDQSLYSPKLKVINCFII
jgi:hypothetical protein